MATGVDKEIENLTEVIARLPGIGPRSASRLVRELLTTKKDVAKDLVEALNRTLKTVTRCRFCNTLTTEEVCPICADEKRDRTIVCVVETPADAAAIEESVAYKGLYFVLMGRVNSIKGVGPLELGFDRLLERVRDGVVKEVVIATSYTTEGETTAHMLIEALKKHVPEVHVTRLSRGLASGVEVEYTDPATLAATMIERK